MKVSVIIPTFNRGPKLRKTVECVLKSDLKEIEKLEVIVVDDGSTHPAIETLKDLSVTLPRTLQCIRQGNSGAGPARNAGFKLATGDLVLFVDDDIWPGSSLVQQHIEAHRKVPNAFIYGRCPIVLPDPPTPAALFVYKRWFEELEREGLPEFITTPAASGNISLFKTEFPDWTEIYSPLPGGDDAELSIRLRQKAVPLWMATRISAPQDQSTEIEDQVKRMNHHAFGLALVAQSYASDERPAEMQEIIEANGALRRGDSAKRVLKKLSLSSILRLKLDVLFLSAVKLMEILRFPESILHSSYSALLNIAYFSGARRAIAREAD